MDRELLSGWPPEHAEQFRKLCDTHTDPPFLPFGSELAKRISGLLPLFRRQSDHMEDYFFAYAVSPLVATVAVLSAKRPRLAHKIFREMDTWLLVPETISVHGGRYRYQGRSIPATYLDEEPASTLEGAVSELEQGRGVVEELITVEGFDDAFDDPQGEDFFSHEYIRPAVVVLQREQEERLQGKKQVDEYALRRVFDFTRLLRELGDLHTAVRLSDYTPAEKDAFYNLLTNRHSLLSSDSIGRLSTQRMLVESGEVDTLKQVAALAWQKSQDPSFDVFVANLKLKGESMRVINVDDDDAVRRFLTTLDKSADFSHVAFQKGGQRYDLPDVLSPIYTPAYELRRSFEAKIEKTLAAGNIVIGRDYQLKERLKTPAGMTFKLLFTRRMPYDVRSGDKIDDTIGIRLLARHEDRCYQVADTLQAVYDSFILDGGKKRHDFIKNPKTNGYRSLDFYLRIDDRPVHVQVRTEEMEYVNEYGSASHYAREHVQFGEFHEEFSQNPDVFVDFFQRLATSFITGFERAQKEQLGSLSYQQIRELYRA